MLIALGIALRIALWAGGLVAIAACSHDEWQPPGPTVSQNGLIVTLELDPNPPRIDGEVVLIDVEDARTKQLLPHVKVLLTVSQLRPPHRRISVKGSDSENSGIYGADVTLNAPGPWRFDVSVSVQGRAAHLRSVQNAVRPTSRGEG